MKDIVLRVAWEQNATLRQACDIGQETGFNNDGMKRDGPLAVRGFQTVFFQHTEAPYIFDLANRVLVRSRQFAVAAAGEHPEKVEPAKHWIPLGTSGSQCPAHFIGCEIFALFAFNSDVESDLIERVR